MRLEEKKAIVTGAAQGLGKAIALRLALEGADVLLADVNLGIVRETADDIAKQSGRRIVAVQTDVTNEVEVREMVKRAVDEFGRIDLLVANAGVLVSGPSTDIAIESWRKVIDVNLTGYFICAREVAKEMIAQGHGNIIQINSKSGKKGSYQNAPYASSKFGGIGLTQSLALELAPHGIRVNCICPGNLLDSPLWVDSLYDQYSRRWCISREEVRKRYLEQVPLKRGCTYDDVTNVLLFLASDESSYMTGQAVNVTGGQEMR
jgi:sorbitol-6-phosphate 2-dehydrogenase